MKTIKTIIFLFILVTASLEAGTIHVPHDFRTIQRAIEAAVDGDEILVQPGTYREDIMIANKSVTISSLYKTNHDEQYIDKTIILSASGGSTIRIIGDSDTRPHLVGFTVTGGLGTPSRWGTRGGGIFVGSRTRPTLERMHLYRNNAVQGGGIYCDITSRPKLLNIRAIENTAEAGGAVYFDYNVLATVENIYAKNNVAKLAGGALYFGPHSEVIMNRGLIHQNASDKGGAVFVYAGDPVFINMTIYDNFAFIGGGGLYGGLQTRAIFINCILWKNNPNAIEMSSQYGSRSEITITHSALEGGRDAIVNYYDRIYWLEGNISSDPKFSKPEAEDFRLYRTSPCIDAGISYFSQGNNVLLDLGENDYSGSAPDMGTEEFLSVTSVDARVEKPERALLVRNYPNPFNSSTIFSFDLPEPAHVKLTIYNTSGQPVARPVNRRLETGEQRIHWNAGSLPSGIYFYRVQTASDFFDGKFLLIR